MSGMSGEGLCGTEIEEENKKNRKVGREKQAGLLSRHHAR